MEVLFIKAFNVSMVAMWLIIAVCLFRLLFRKAPKRICVLLWGMVALRLVMPFSFQSPFSIVPSTQTIRPFIAFSSDESVMENETMTFESELTNESSTFETGMANESSALHIVNSGNLMVDKGLNAVLGISASSKLSDGLKRLQTRFFALSVIWALGIVGFAFYGLISSLRLRRKVREAVLTDGDIWLCDQVDTPFILGVLRPVIYLPSCIGEKDREYVIAHERAHLKSWDHVLKLCGYLLVCVYWFHPMVWVAYVLFCRDIEMACDERVVTDMSMSDRKAYAKALVNCSVRQRTAMVYPLAFGEVAVKERVKDVLHYKKPAFWILLVSLLVCLLLALGFLTDPGLSFQADATKVESISVFSGNSGRALEITDQEGIGIIVDYVNHLRLKRGKWSFGYMGYGYRVTIHIGKKRSIDFMINASELLRKDPYFYSIEGGTELYSYLAGLFEKQVERIADSEEILSGDNFNAAVWGRKLREQYEKDAPYAVGKDCVITVGQMEARQYFYQIRGLEEEAAKRAALQELMEEEALYQNAISKGCMVNEQEVRDYLSEMKRMMESTDGSGDQGELQVIMEQFDSEDSYWTFEYSVVQRDMTIRKYVDELIVEYLKNHPYLSESQKTIYQSESQKETECQEYLEQIKKKMVEEQAFQLTSGAK